MRVFRLSDQWSIEADAEITALDTPLAALASGIYADAAGAASSGAPRTCASRRLLPRHALLRDNIRLIGFVRWQERIQPAGLEARPATLCLCDAEQRARHALQPESDLETGVTALLTWFAWKRYERELRVRFIATTSGYWQQNRLVAAHRAALENQHVLSDTFSIVYGAAGCQRDYDGQRGDGLTSLACCAGGSDVHPPLTRRGMPSLPAALALPRGAQAQPGPGRFAAIAYHEIGEDGRDKHYSISGSALVQHFSFLRQDGWHFIGIDALLAARDGRRPLPDKALLLSFDDGYDDYATRVFPLLRAFNVPGVFALVTSWMDTPANATFDYGGTPTPRRSLITWAQARQMQASGLCEFASHTHDLHHGVPANPQGNVEPAVVTRIWNGARYETDAEWKRRIETDLARASTILARELGRRPRCIVWPYGRYNMEAVGIARRLGMPVAMTLDPEPTRPTSSTASAGCWR